MLEWQRHQPRLPKVSCQQEAIDMVMTKTNNTGSRRNFQYYLYAELFYKEMYLLLQSVDLCQNFFNYFFSQANLFGLWHGKDGF